MEDVSGEAIALIVIIAVILTIVATITGFNVWWAMEKLEVINRCLDMGKAICPIGVY